MEQEEEEGIFSDTIIELYEKVFNEIFVDLREIDEMDKMAFLSLFIGRNNQITEIMPIIRNFKDNAMRKKSNILIKGSAGVGKTTLMLRIIKEKNLFDDKLEYIFLDFNDTIGFRDSHGFLLELIKKIEIYFKNSPYPINTFDDLNDINKLVANYLALMEHLKLIDKERDFPKKLVLIIDDLDYADDYWKDILDQIIKFANFKNILLILNARPPLINDIMKTNDRFRIKFTREVKTIELNPIEILNLITSRISIFLNDESVRSSDSGIFSRVFKFLDIYTKKHPIEAIISKTNICSKDDLSQIRGKLDIYFTEEDIQFISNITNGNIREIFCLTQTLLLFVLRNYNRLKKHKLHGMIIPKDELFGLFMDDTKSFYFINIFEKNGAIYNLLKFFEINQFLRDSDLIKLRKECKMSIKDVEHTIEKMLSPSNRLICPVSTNIFSKDINMYDITPKGKYYLNELSQIEEYKKAFK